jgi:plastocyanin
VNSPTAAAAETPAAGAATTLALEGLNSTFSTELLEAPAGTVTIEFDNRDGGVVHNVHVFLGEDNTGEDVGETELEVGPVQQTLTMTLEPGDYFYVCDAHPTTMSGTLRVT